MEKVDNQEAYVWRERIEEFKKSGFSQKKWCEEYTIDGLAAVVTEKIQRRPFEDAMFVFHNRNLDKIKKKGSACGIRERKEEDFTFRDNFRKKPIPSAKKTMESLYARIQQNKLAVTAQYN